MFCRPTDPGSGSGSKRPRPDSPPLFSDDEETPVSQRARVASEDGGDGDDFMAGFGDKFADLESDAVERGGALVYAFVIGEAAIEQVDAQWRNEALERKARFERIEKKGQVLVPGPPSDTVTAIPDETTDNTGQLRAEHGHNQNSVILDEDAALALQLQMEWNQEHAGGAVQRADANNETAKTALALAVAEEKRREEFRRMRLAQEEDDARFARELQLQEESHYRQVARAQVAQHQPQLAGTPTPLPAPSSPPAIEIPSDDDYPAQQDPYSARTNQIIQTPFKPLSRASTSFPSTAQQTAVRWNPTAGCYEPVDVPKPSLFIPPAPMRAKHSNTFHERSTAYTPPVLPQRASSYHPSSSSSFSSTSSLSSSSAAAADAIYDMNSLLGQGGKLPYSGYLPNGSQKFWGVPKPGEEQFDVELDAFARPLREGEVAEQLKDLLENVAITAAVPAVEERLQSPPELKVTLLEHQKIGVEWMLKMERGSNKGGILADDMGLGKTIQSIACCILNRSQDKTKKATLIVAPTSLILQWREEIRTRVAGGTFKCLVYYGKDKKDIKSAPALNQYDIVITSYGTVTQEWPEVKKKKKRGPNDPFPSREGEDERYEQDLRDEEEDRAAILSQRGILFKNHWHRVILDEAHTIKNKATRGARSCVQLVSTHRWCLTGTPIQNNIGELYSLINFLDIRPYCDWSKFRDDIERPFKLGKHKRVMKRVQALLKALCLRRTKNSMLDGRPIITLPEKRVEVVEADFSPSEREFYNSLEKKTLLKFNAYLREGTVMQNYSNVLVLLLRLRQACCHPSLVAQNFNEAPPELLEAAEASQARPLDPLEVLNGDIQERLLGMKLKSAYECPICFDALTDGKIIPACGHVFCGDCILGHVAAVGLNGADEEKTCPTCRGDIDVPLLVSVDAFLSAAKKVGMTADAEDVSTTVSNPQDGPGDDTGALSEKAKGKMPRQIRDRDLNDADEADDYGPDRSEWISSTKIDQMMAVVLKTRRENPGDKTIIFTQFRGMMDLCEKPLKENQIGFVRYDGSMSAEQRDNAVSTLQNDPDTNVILVSLKCGSLGLNLTCCNRVIIVDFWWNVAVENQAVDRVHRFGQTKPVFVHRISVKETVEQRILQLQHEKQELFNAALGEGGVKGLSRNRLGLQDLIKLFKGGLGGDVSDEEDA